MKITTEVCKLAVVNKCKTIGQFIKDEFVPPLTDKELEETFEVKNWKREYKIKEQTANGRKIIERLFDCRPFDSQLRAYVYTDENDSRIEKIEVVGE